MVDFILSCDYAFTIEGGKLALIGMFDIIGVRELPSNHPEMFVVAHLKGKENSEHEIKLKIENPEGKNILPQDTP